MANGDFPQFSFELAQPQHSNADHQILAGRRCRKRPRLFLNANRPLHFAKPGRARVCTLFSLIYVVLICRRPTLVGWLYQLRDSASLAKVVPFWQKGYKLPLFPLRMDVTQYSTHFASICQMFRKNRESGNLFLYHIGDWLTCCLKSLILMSLDSF